MLYISLLTVFSLWACRYRYSQCSGGHITTESDGLQRKRPGSEASQAHRAPPRDLCMNWIPSRRWQDSHRAPGGFHWSYSHGLSTKGHIVNNRKACKNWVWMLFDSGEEMYPLALVVPFFPGCMRWKTSSTCSSCPLCVYVGPDEPGKQELETCRLTVKMSFSTTALVGHLQWVLAGFFHFHAMWLCISRAPLVCHAVCHIDRDKKTLVLHH